MKQLLFCLVWFVSLGMDGAAFPLTSGHHVAPYEVYRDTFREGRYEEAMRQIDAHIAERADLQESRSFRYMVWCSDRAAILAHIGRTEEAIAAMEEVVVAYPEPVFLWRLANLYEITGHPNEALRTLSLLDLQESHRWSFFLPDENLAAVGRIAEVLGEDPKRLLSNFYTVLLRNFPGSAPVLLAAADLASRHNAYDLAEKYLLQILEEDPQHIEALAGLATCYDKASDPRLSAVLESLIQLDPRNLGAIAIQTKNLLDLGDTPAARRLLDIALKINPSHPELNAYQAALHYLEDDLDAMQAIQEKILARNPRGSIVYSIPGKTASRHYRFSDGAAMQEKAVMINPEDTEARTQYALDLLRLGQDDKAKGELERVFAANAYDVQVYNLLNLLDSIHAFERIETDAFILQLPHKETAALHGPMRKLLNEAVAVFEEKYEITLQKPITIQVFDNHDDFMVRSVGLPGNIGFQGICFGPLITMDSPSARPRHEMNWQSVLWHEFAHVVTLQKTKHRMPRWLSEGISVYEETLRHPAWGQKRDIRYKALLEEESLPTLTRLEAYFVQPKSTLHVLLGYFLSAEFVRFYVETVGQPALNAALAQIGTGSDTISALTAQARLDESQLTAAFHEFLKPRLAPYENIPATGNDKGFLESIMQIETKEKADLTAWIDRDSPYTNALRVGLEAMAAEDWATAEQHLKNAHTLFPDYTGSQSPQKLLLQLYKKLDRPREWKEMLWNEMAWDPIAFDAAMEAIQQAQVEEAWPAVERAAEHALAIDPFSIPALTALGTAHAKQTEFAAALQINTQLLLMDPPHAREYQLQRLALLQQTGDLATAKHETLRFLEQYPNQWQAQQILLSLSESAPEAH